jgi:hypothetical protein
MSLTAYIVCENFGTGTIFLFINDFPVVKEFMVNCQHRSILFETVEPLVKTTLEGFKLSGFTFDRDRVFLGQVPPRITGVKVGSKTV